MDWMKCSLKDLSILILSLVVLAAFFMATYYILSDRITTSDTQALLLIGTAYGAVATNAGAIVSYWFGTSKTSAEKDKQISDMTKTPAKDTP